MSRIWFEGVMVDADGPLGRLLDGYPPRFKEDGERIKAPPRCVDPPGAHDSLTEKRDENLRRVLE